MPVVYEVLILGLGIRTDQGQLKENPLGKYGLLLKINKRLLGTAR